MRTVSRMSATREVISAEGTFLDFRPKATFSDTVMWGNRAYCWNTVFTLRL